MGEVNYFEVSTSVSGGTVLMSKLAQLILRLEYGRRKRKYIPTLYTFDVAVLTKLIFKW
jgi:hypothetical protein